MRSRVYIWLSFMVLAAITSASAESLWTPASGSLIADKKARQVGDIVTILIVESTSSVQKASTGFDKKIEHGNDVGVGFLMKNLPEIGISSGQKGSSSGQTSRTSNFVAKITATVTKVLPNGNLEVEGTRTIETNKEKQEIKLTGTVRQQDISPDNTVLSTYLADAEIKSTGKGPIGDRQKEGFISQLIKWLF